MINKKLYFLLVGLFHFIAIIVLYIFNFRSSAYLLSAFVFGFIFVLAYTFNRIYQGRKGILFKIVFASLCSLSSMLILASFPSLSLYPKLFYAIVSSFGLYMLLLSMNIYIVAESSEEAIPLLQPAKAVVYMYQLMTVFFSSIIIYKFLFDPSNPFLQLWVSIFLFGSFYFILFRSIDWFYLMEGNSVHVEPKKTVIRRLGVFAVIFLTELSVSLSFYPLEDFARATLVAGALYVVSSIIQNYLLHKITSKLILDAGIIFAFLYLITYFL